MKFGIITNWFYKNFMAINSEKCHFMCIGRNRENETFTFKDAVIKTARKKLFLGELLIINWILIVTQERCVKKVVKNSIPSQEYQHFQTKIKRDHF